MRRSKFRTIAAAGAMLLAACAGPLHGPDKQFGGSLQGAVTGAGAGAVTGFQVGAGTGPGAAVGAGLGAVAGGIQGFAQDQSEEDLLRLARQTRQERETAFAQEVLQEHFKRRIELHPTRDIFPADLFFSGDETKLTVQGKSVLSEIARLNRNRVPWSRLAIVAYARGTDAEALYARHLVSRRAKEIVNYFVRCGLEGRRLEARGVLIDAPLLIDPLDSPVRYNQAVEFVPVDR